ncbi:MAG: CHC2 zinc finger domain-containing protein, partial [Pseudomonadota bacterium]
MIPQPFIHDLLNRVDIVDAIDRHVPLKKAGANFVACCPFHSEKTPSFT